MNISSHSSFNTKIFESNIKTLEIGVDGNPYALPILELDDEEVFTIEFDELSHHSKSYSYKILHCNADWIQSDLNSSEYLEGFTTADIVNSETSVNTSILYTHYQFQFPNDEMKIKLSGNYVVQIIEDNKLDRPVAQVCFSVVEPRVKVEAKVRPNTDIEINGRFQQLDFEILNPTYRIDNPEEIKILVRQNSRLDNQVLITKPTYLNTGSIGYRNNKDLIFEGGNEFRRFDFSSYYSTNESIEDIRTFEGFKHIYVALDKPVQGSYLHHPDANGNFIINFQEAFENADIEADYAYIHLRIKSPVFFDGRLYLGGKFMYDEFNTVSQMEYNTESGCYEKTLFLKQGGYTYQYRFLPKGKSKATLSRTENSYWQTNNDYQIFVYHRPWGARADKLIGFTNITSN